MIYYSWKGQARTLGRAEACPKPYPEHLADCVQTSFVRFASTPPSCVHIAREKPRSQPQMADRPPVGPADTRDFSGGASVIANVRTHWSESCFCTTKWSEEMVFIHDRIGDTLYVVIVTKADLKIMAPSGHTSAQTSSCKSGPAA